MLFRCILLVEAGLTRHACFAGAVSTSQFKDELQYAAQKPIMLAGAGSSIREAAPLLDHVSALARALEGQRARGGTAICRLAARLLVVAERLGADKSILSRLTTAFL